MSLLTESICGQIGVYSTGLMASAWARTNDAHFLEINNYNLFTHANVFYAYDWEPGCILKGSIFTTTTKNVPLFIKTHIVRSVC